MKVIRLFFITLVFSVLFASCMGTAPSVDPERFASENSELIGTWSGNTRIFEKDMQVQVHIFADGAILDLPEDGLWTYPLGRVSLATHEISFELLMGGEVFPVHLLWDGEALKGGFDTEHGTGSFFLNRVSEAEPENSFSVRTPTGPIHGELRLASGGKNQSGPLVLIVPDAGNVDRNGNILGAGGRGDTYLLLSEAFAEAGISTARYDKRGVGYSYPRIKSDADLSFSAYIDDLILLIEMFQKDRRFTRLVLLGHGEGSLVAAAALQKLGKKAEKGLSFIALSPQSRTVQAFLREEVASYGSESLEEFDRVLADILHGGTGEPLPDFLQPVFTQGMLTYWRTWMALDPEQIYPSLDIPLLLVRGENETVCTLYDIEVLMEISPHASFAPIPSMNQVLKEGSGDQNELYFAYLDSDHPLSPRLIKALVSFVMQ